MTSKRHISHLCGLFGLCFSLQAAEPGEAVGDRLMLPDEQITIILRQTAMPELGKGRLAKILTRYYVEGLGGAENWEKISSLKVSGTLKLKDDELQINAYQKKPNLMKMTLRGNQRELVLAYDGTTAWKKLPGRENKPQPMPKEEARRFKHSAHFGNFLLYPFGRGKTIEYIDTVPVEGAVCHQIRVHMDGGFQIDYFIDIRTYLEIKVINTDLENEKTHSLIYKDYIREFGMPIAKQVETYEDGEWISSLTLNEVQVNSGVMPWMFKMRK